MIRKFGIFLVFITLFYSGCNNTGGLASARWGINGSGEKLLGLDIVTEDMVKKLTSNRNFYEDEGPSVAITSFYFIENKNQSNRLSIILADSIIHQMRKQGYKPIDYKLMPTIEVTNEGYKVTKNFEELKEKGMGYALIGTLTELYDGILINARIIELKSGVVVSSAQGMIHKDLIIQLFEEPQYRSLYENKLQAPATTPPTDPTPATTESVPTVTQPAQNGGVAK